MSAQEGAVAPRGFDYSGIDPVVADDARAAADRIRARLQASYRETGRDLAAMKERLGHGQFGRWLQAEFGMSSSTANNYMNAARWLDGKNPTVGNLPAAIVYLLSAPSAPTAVVDEVIASADRGKLMSPPVIRAKLAEATCRKLEIIRVDEPSAVAATEALDTEDVEAIDEDEIAPTAIDIDDDDGVPGSKDWNEKTKLFMAGVFYARAFARDDLRYDRYRDPPPYLKAAVHAELIRQIRELGVNLADIPDPRWDTGLITVADQMGEQGGEGESEAAQLFKRFFSDEAEDAHRKAERKRRKERKAEQVKRAAA